MAIALALVCCRLFEARIGAQASREQRLAVADEVIDNNGDLASLRRQVEALLARLAERV